jgi:hypothetical protein
MPVWPVSLPQAPIADGYQEQQGDSLLRTPMDLGPAKQRPKNTGGVKPVLWTWELDGGELTAFETFFEQTLEGGALAFEMTHPRTGLGITVRIVKPPVAHPVTGDIWQLPLQLEVLP